MFGPDEKCGLGNRKVAEDLEHLRKAEAEKLREQQKRAKLHRSILEMQQHNNCVVLNTEDKIRRFMDALTSQDGPNARRSEALPSTDASSGTQASLSASAAAPSSAAAETSGAAAKEPVNIARYTPQPGQTHRSFLSGLFPQPMQAPPVSSPRHRPSPGSADAPAMAPAPLPDPVEMGTHKGSGRNTLTAGAACGLDLAELTESLIQQLAVSDDLLPAVDSAPEELCVTAAESHLPAVPDGSAARAEAAQHESHLEQQEISSALEGATTLDASDSSTISECDAESSRCGGVSGEAFEEPPAASTGALILPPPELPFDAATTAAATSASLPPDDQQEAISHAPVTSSTATCPESEAAAALDKVPELLPPDEQKDTTGEAAESPSTAADPDSESGEIEGEEAAAEAATIASLPPDTEKESTNKAAESPSNIACPDSQPSGAAMDVTAAEDARTEPHEAGSCKKEDTVKQEDSATQCPSLSGGGTVAEEEQAGLSSSAGQMTPVEQILESVQGGAGSHRVDDVPSEERSADAVTHGAASAAEAVHGASGGGSPLEAAQEEDGSLVEAGAEAPHPAAEAEVTVVGVWKGENTEMETASVETEATALLCDWEAEPEETSSAEQKEDNVELADAVSEAAAVAEGEATTAGIASYVPASCAAANKAEGEAMPTETASESPAAASKAEREATPTEIAPEGPASPAPASKAEVQATPAETVPASSAAVGKSKKKKEKRKLKAAAAKAAAGADSPADEASTQDRQPKPPSPATAASSLTSQEGPNTGASQVAVQPADESCKAEQDGVVQEIQYSLSPAADAATNSNAEGPSQSAAGSSASQAETVKAEELSSQEPSQDGRKTEVTLHEAASKLKAHREEKAGGDADGQKHGGGFLANVSNLVGSWLGMGKQGDGVSSEGSSRDSAAPETPSSSASTPCEDVWHANNCPSKQASSVIQ